jgi:hypothetical protein
MNITYPGIVLAGTQESARVADAKKCAHFILRKFFKNEIKKHTNRQCSKVRSIQYSTLQYLGEKQEGKKERRKEGN